MTRYRPYSEYSNSANTVGSLGPAGWRRERLRFSINSNPVKSEVSSWADDINVSFIPMDAVGENGGLNTDRESAIVDVYTGYTYFRDGDVVIAKITPCFENGKGAIAEGLRNGIGFGTTELHVLRPLETLDAKWLFYLSISDPFRRVGASEMLGAGGQKRIPEDFIKNFVVCIPTVTEQKQIALFLDWKIKQNDSLIFRKKALLAKLVERRFTAITHAVTKGLMPNVAMRDSGVSWLEQIPAHWEVKRLRFVLKDQFTNGLFKKAEYWGDGTRIVNVSDLYIHNDLIDETKLERLECDVNELQRHSAVHGDFFIVRSSLKLEGVGKSATLLSPSEPTVFECHTVRGRPDQNIVLPRFLNLFINSTYARQYFMTRANLVTMATIDQERIKNLFVALPRIDEQQQIVSYLDEELARLDAMMSTVEKAIDCLTEYRSALITAAVTGKIDVRDVKIPANV